MADISFDDLYDHFKNKIYGSEKGRLRQAVIEQALHLHLSDIFQMKDWQIADVGGGLGQATLMLAKHGHQVSYFDLSARMTAHARHEVEQAGLIESVQFNTGAFQSLLPGKQYDLVFAQAILEWLAEPELGLACLQQAVRPGGYFVLVFYNDLSIRFKNLLRGNYRQAFAEDLSGDRKGLTPINPLNANNVYHQIEQQGFEIVSKSGIRTFSDYLFPHVNREKLADAIQEAELTLSEQEPFLSLARYICVIAKNENPGELQFV